MSSTSRSAATDSNRHLFVKNGSQLVFHLPPGETKKKLAPVVKRCGGELTSKRQKNVICLADERLWKSGSDHRGSDCYWPTYVLDCVKQNTLLNIEPYKCSAGTRLMRRIPCGGGDDGPVHESNMEGDDDDDMAPAKMIIRVPVERKGRSKYTKVEDLNILKYLVEQGEYTRARGIAVWRTMEKLQVTGHPAQSMMTRYRDVISRNLDQYNIPDNWKSCLTGNLALAAQTPQADAGGGGKQQTGQAEETTDTTVPCTSKAPQQQNQSLPPGRESDDFFALDLEEEDDFDRQLIQMSRSPVKGKPDNTVQTRLRSSVSSARSQAELSLAEASPRKRRLLRGDDRGSEISGDEDLTPPSKRNTRNSSKFIQKIARRRQGNSERDEEKGGGDSDEVEGCASRHLRRRALSSSSEDESSDSASTQQVEAKTVRHLTGSKDLPASQKTDSQRSDSERARSSASGTRSSGLNPESRKAESHRANSQRPDPSRKPSTRSMSSLEGRHLRNSQSSPRRHRMLSSQNSPQPKRKKTAPSAVNISPPKQKPERRSLPLKKKATSLAEKSRQSPQSRAKQGQEKSSPMTQLSQSPSAQKPSTSSVHQRSETPTPLHQSSKGKRQAGSRQDSEAHRPETETYEKEGTGSRFKKVQNLLNQNQKKGGVGKGSFHPDIADDEHEVAKEGKKKKGKQWPARAGSRQEPQQVASGELTPPSGGSSTEGDYLTAEDEAEGQNSGRSLGEGQSSGDRRTSSHHAMQAFICNSDEEDPDPRSSDGRCREQRRMTALGVVRALSAEFDLTLAEARAIYFRCSGHVKATRYWIQTGHTLPGYQYWTPREDRVLLEFPPDHADWQTLEQRRGLSVVLQRIHWLQSGD